MPVYVTRAHVTIGDANRKASRRGPIVPKHVFQVSDLRHTPYCIRTLVVTFIGFLIVGGGVIMTIIGYKPSIILPWYRSSNESDFYNATEPSAVPRILGEPGPLRVLVYIGPILMGLGAFSMMVAIVLFCEIKDRYFNNIVPKTVPEQRQKGDIYDKIIDEFRKNYFRGIEVPLKAVTRRKSKGRFSFSLSRSGSLLSFGRRLSHDFQKRKRERKASRESRESQSERVTATKHKRSSLKRITDPDSWMKTSSLPNIRHKGSPHCFYELEECSCMSATRTSQSCGPTLEQIQLTDSANGVDNPAYRDSPPGKRLHRHLTKHASLETPGVSTHLTTVMVHRESHTENEPERPSSFLPELRCSSNREENHSRLTQSQSSVIDIEKDIQLLPRFNVDNETEKSIPPLSTRGQSAPMKSETIKIENEMCSCGTDFYCKQHALGMDSGGSSLSLSWENIPSEWNDARRNTEPIVVYRRSFNNIPKACNGSDSKVSIQNIAPDSSSLKLALEKASNGASSDSSIQTDDHLEQDQKKDQKLSAGRGMLGPFSTKINIFKSDSNLCRSSKYSLLRSNHSDNISLDSLSLTDDMLKHFEMTTETAQI